MIQTRPRPVEPLERQRRHVLRRDPAAEQRDRIRMHVGGTLPKQPIE